jgi:tetratricopeptide (TPR) repeat protein
LRGVEQLRSYGPDVNRRARELFEQAIALDPRYALAHAYLALSLVVESGYNNAPEAIKQRALETALTAVRLDPRESRCHIYLGQIHRFRSEFDLAISHLERGLALNPNDTTGMIHLASVFAVSGRAEEGIEILRRAITLDPYLRFYWGTLGTCLYTLRRYDEALAAHQKLERDKPPWWLAKEAACLAQLGRFEEAHALAAEVLRRKPTFSVRAEMPRYKNPTDEENLRQGLLMAGLPE